MSHYQATVSPLDRLRPLVPSRRSRDWAWYEGEPAPAELPMTQSWGWLFVPDGRIVVLIDPADRLSLLPGGTIEETDSGDPAAALDRKAAEEAQLALGPAHYLGYQYDETGDVYGGIGPCARIRMAAAVTHIGPSAPDPSTGRTMVRLLVTPHQAVGLLGWGEMGHRQADAAIRAATLLWGYPRGAARPITEISPTGGDL